MEAHELPALKARVYKLEWRLRCAFIGWAMSIAILALLGVLVQHVASQPSVLRARTLNIVDDKARVRIVLDTSSTFGEPNIQLRDEAGKTRLWLTIAGVTPSDAPVVQLLDEAGKIQFELAASESLTQLQMGVGRGARVSLSASPTGTLLNLRDDVRQRFELYVPVNDAPTMRMFDSTGRVPVWSAP